MKIIKCKKCKYTTGTFHSKDSTERVQYHDDPNTGICCDGSGKPLKAKKQPCSLAMGLLNAYRDAVSEYETEMNCGTDDKLEKEAKEFERKTRERLEEYIYKLEQKAEK